MRIIIADTGPLLHLDEAGAIDWLSRLGEVPFLTDDTAARVAAESAGLNVRGSIGVVLANAAFHLAPREEAESILDALETRSTLWLSAKVRGAARQALQAIFAGADHNRGDCVTGDYETGE